MINGVDGKVKTEDEKEELKEKQDVTQEDAAKRAKMTVDNANRATSAMLRLAVKDLDKALSTSLSLIENAPNEE